MSNKTGRNKRDTSGAQGNSSSWRSPRNNINSTKNDFKKLEIRNFPKDDGCTHFISIPFDDEKFKNSFNAFRNDVLDNSKTYRINENIVQKTEKLHKTILNLKLSNKDEIDRAKEVLEDEKGAIEEILKGSTAEKHVVIRGIKEPTNYMRTAFLFMKVISPILQRIQGHLMKALQRANLTVLNNARGLPPQIDQIVMISKNLLTPENTQNIDYTFNPGPIMRKYGNYEFGKFNITEMHLSRRYVYEDDGYFKNEMVLNF
ncbi:uncharacterized protein LOC129792815 [Lutzomyia longipalpis]|uniref:uncharacterized protein LOC129792815 n=1 Tax=Lutzomyia longipalpis TaxID=7200 RepID=UPI0024837723|nr:uncharacterized protein LOC129792815 [Lutzomyia longipalpis]